MDYYIIRKHWNKLVPYLMKFQTHGTASQVIMILFIQHTKRNSFSIILIKTRKSKISVWWLMSDKNICVIGSHFVVHTGSVNRG